MMMQKYEKSVASLEKRIRKIQAERKGSNQKLTLLRKFHKNLYKAFSQVLASAPHLRTVLANVNERVSFDNRINIHFTEMEICRGFTFEEKFVDLKKRKQAKIDKLRRKEWEQRPMVVPKFIKQLAVRNREARLARATLQPMNHDGEQQDRVCRLSLPLLNPYVVIEPLLFMPLRVGASNRRSIDAKNKCSWTPSENEQLVKQAIYFANHNMLWDSSTRLERHSADSCRSHLIFLLGRFPEQYFFRIGVYERQYNEMVARAMNDGRFERTRRVTTRSD